MEVSRKVEKFSLFDIDGSAVGFSFKDKKKVMHLCISLALFVICLFLPLDFISPTASKALALTVLVLYMWISLYVDIMTGCMVLAVGGVLMGLFTFNNVRTTLGNSQFVAFMGICAVAIGATNTKLTKRFAYAMLIQFGKSPRMIVFSAIIVGIIISSNVSNIATAVLLGAIYQPVIEALGDKDRLGRCVMIIIPMATMYGGLAMPNGSSPNLVAMQNIETVTEGMYVISYGQWSALGWPTCLVLMFPMLWLYNWYFKVPKRNENIDVNIFREQMKELGPVSGPEIRWLITLLAMTTTLIMGYNIGTMGILFGTISILPGVGIMSGNTMLKQLPWSLLFIIGISPLISTVLSGSGLDQVLVGGLVPLMGGMGPFMLIFFFGLMKSILNNVIVNGATPVMIIMITIFAPMLIEMGYNPVTIMSASFLLSCPTSVFASVSNFQCTFHYGYFRMTDTIVPGTIYMFLAPLLTTVVCYFICPMIGLPFYI